MIGTVIPAEGVFFGRPELNLPLSPVRMPQVALNRFPLLLQRRVSPME